jgi:hypothetical protein
VGDNTIEDEAEETTVEVSKTIAFHDGTFADSDDPHSDGSITAAATAGHIYSDTATGTYTWGTLTSCERTAMANNEHSTENWAYRNGTVDPPTAGYTTYKWTPPSAITNGRTLVVAGGGGGGADMGGGAGAGGLLASTSTNIPESQQTIQVGDGGSRGYDTNSHRLAGGNGADSSISGPGITAIGGGGGATAHNYNDRPAGNGGSGGGGSGGVKQHPYTYGGARGTGTAGQGNDGANSGTHWYPGGGGGAGGMGYGADGQGGQNVRGDGGEGVENDILGTAYWWAGGGGAASHSNHQAPYAGHGGKGGGGGGAHYHSSSMGHPLVTNDANGLTTGEIPTSSGSSHVNSGGSGGKHTGGGGGGGEHDANSDPTKCRGGRGGSGIVVIKFTALGTTKGIAGSTAITSTGSGTTADTPSLTLDATTEAATPTLDLNFTTAMTSFPKNIGRYNIATHDTLGVVFDRTATKKKRVTKTINTDKFTMELTANNAASGTIGDLVTFGDDFTLAANTTTSGEYTIAANFDGTTSNVYMNGALITSASTSVTAGAKLLTLGQNYAGRIKDFKFWNLAKRFFVFIAFHHGAFSSSDYSSAYSSVTAAATAGHVYSDTATGTYTWGTLGSVSTQGQQIQYTWTPASTITAAVLMVAGGGGGGAADNNNGGGGGGGAGGLVYNASVSLSGEKTIKVGGPNSSRAGDGANTEFTDLTNAVGGGAGGGSGTSGGGISGGSGGGAFRAGTGGAGTADQGNAGGTGSQTLSPSYDQGGSGGGGAGGAGVGATSVSDGANGGIGLDYSSVFGTVYGDSGWFASGGGGGFHSGSTPGTASNGGGGNGASTTGSGAYGDDGTKHTGGGGGGGSNPASSSNGSYGGSGIVLIKY